MRPDLPPRHPATLTRRRLLQGGLSLGALGTLAGLPSTYAAEEAATLPENAVILFQGDSITDNGRRKDLLEPNNTAALGKGYAAVLAGELLLAHPGKNLKIYNRGISGNKVPDLAARWEEDAIKLKPAILSILVGINDLWHTIAFGSKYKGTIEDYETGYRDLITRSQKEIPSVRVVVCEPFTLRDWPAFDRYREVAKKIATELNLTFVPFQSVFDQAAEAAPKDFWLWDGIHTTPPGDALMAQAWREAVGI